MNLRITYGRQSEASRNSLTYGYCGIFQSAIKSRKNENGILLSGRRDWAATHGIGVFATRSPYRPNHIGLSCVRLKEVAFDHRGPVLRVLGADLLNGTPIYDIKPYLPYADSFPDAKSGFASSAPKRTEVEFSCPVPGGISDEMLADIRELLKQDPRPAYQRDPGRIYGMKYAGVEIKFKGSEEKITVCDISFYPSI